MSPILALPGFLGVAGLVFWLTGRFRRYALAKDLLDVPNPRSSHATATPRGGGVVVALTTLMALPVLHVVGALSGRLMWGLLGGGALAAAIGFSDDLRPIAARWRLLGHFLAAGWVLAWLGVPPPLPVLASIPLHPWPGYLFGAVYVVWMLNLTNFMDGIDGMAGVEVITVCLGGALVWLVAAPGDAQWSTPVVLAAASLGFLAWNWPPAKIFLGDAGSGFVGFMLAALSLQAGRIEPAMFWAWVILLGVFVSDATVTLARRVASGQRFYEAHRSHAYQHAARWCGAHRPVTISVGVINLLWLLPVALLVGIGVLDGPKGVLVAYVPIVAGALWLGAGVPERTAGS